LRNVGLLLSLIFTLGACGHGLVPDSDEINVYPTNYKNDIVAAMHTYLNNPTGIRDQSAAIARLAFALMPAWSPVVALAAARAGRH